MKKYTKNTPKQKIPETGFKTISEASGKIEVKDRPKYIITNLDAHLPKDIMVYRELPGTEYQRVVKEREWTVELRFISSGDVSKLTVEQIGGFLFKLLEDNPIQP